LNRVEVLEKMEPVLNTQVRDVDHNPRTRVAVTPEVITFRPGGGQHTLEVTETGAHSLANFVGLPWPIAAKLHPATFGSVATDLLEAKRQYSLVLKDQRVTAVVRRGHYHPVNPERALRAIEAGVPGIEFHQLMILEDLVVSIDVVGENREPVAAGDLVQAGANIAFSPMGTVDPSIRSFVLRLEFHWGGGGDPGGNAGSDNIWQWFRRSSRDAYNALNHIVQRYREMSGEEIPQGQRAAMLESLLRQARISGEAAIGVRAMAIENPPQNSYDMMNLISYASSHLLEAPKQVERARQTVTNYISEDTHARVCPVCHQRR
jgi:hypothetical protein